MYYVVKVDHNGMVIHLIRSDCEGFLRSVILSNAMNGWDWSYVVEWQ